MWTSVDCYLRPVHLQISFLSQALLLALFAKLGHEEMLALVFEFEADVTKGSLDSSTLLMFAAMKGPLSEYTKHDSCICARYAHTVEAQLVFTSRPRMLDLVMWKETQPHQETI